MTILVNILPGKEVPKDTHNDSFFSNVKKPDYIIFINNNLVKYISKVEGTHQFIKLIYSLLLLSGVRNKKGKKFRMISSYRKKLYKL